MTLGVTAVLVSPALSGTALAVLIDGALKGLVLLGAASMAIWAMRRASPATRHFVWLGALVCTLVVPLSAWVLPEWQALPRWMKWEEEPRALTRASWQPSRQPAEPSLRVPGVPSGTGQMAKPGMDAITPTPSLPHQSAPFRARLDGKKIVLAWLIGFTTFVAPLLWSLSRLTRLSRRATLLLKGPMITALRELQLETGVLQPIRLYQAAGDSMPMVWGAFRSRMLLPAGAVEWSDSRLRAVLLHELAHIRRRDPLALLAAQVALAFHWFNPLAWLALRQLRVEQERACDDEVLCHGIRATDYASDLLAVVSGCHRMHFATALSMAAPALEGRIARILDARLNRRAVSRWLTYSGAALMFVCALPLAMLRAADPARTNALPAPQSPSIAEPGSGRLPPLQLEGWVFTWPRSEHRWYANLFDSEGEADPGVISTLLEQRKSGAESGIWREGVGTKKSVELRALISAFRGRAGVAVEKLGALPAVDRSSARFPEETRIPFTAAGEDGNIVVKAEEQAANVEVRWVSHGSDGHPARVSYRLDLGMSLCALLPGPAEPANIRMLVLRCTSSTEPFVEKMMRGRILDRHGVVLAEGGTVTLRKYPLTALAGHLLGYVAPRDRTGPDEGRAGLESLLDSELSEGKDVRVSLDARMQSATEGILRQSGVGRGAAVILDPWTGDLLAEVSIPNFDPGIFVPAISLKDWNSLNGDPSHPLVNRGVEAYPPGSLFKTVVALAAYRNGKADRSYTCTGEITYGETAFKCRQPKGHGKLNLTDALVKSCDCYFYQLANEIGISSLSETAHELGLGEATGIDLLHEAAGLFPTPAFLKEHFPAERWSMGYTANVGIGQGWSLVTPLQMANMAATIATGGRHMVPQLRSHGLPGIHNDLTTTGWTSRQLTTLGETMREMVRSGTAAGAKSDLISIAGQTSSAQMISEGVKQTAGWFVGYAPSEAPQYAIAVFVESGSGSGVAAPIARRILEAVAQGLPAAEPQAPVQGHLQQVSEGR